MALIQYRPSSIGLGREMYVQLCIMMIDDSNNIYIYIMKFLS